MRDKHFVAAHCGGLLTKENHRELIKWAVECSEHVLHLLKNPPDDRLAHALRAARDWANGSATVGAAMKASREAHAAARDQADPVSIAIARSIAQGVATAHMADHSMGAALYALQAVHEAGETVEREAGWQNERLPPELVELVRAAMIEKGKGFRSLNTFFKDIEK